MTKINEIKQRADELAFSLRQAKVALGFSHPMSAATVNLPRQDLECLVSTIEKLSKDYMFKTSEEYHADRDLFCRYVYEEINPVRKAHGLAIAERGIAERLYDVMRANQHRE